MLFKGYKQTRCTRKPSIPSFLQNSRVLNFQEWQLWIVELVSIACLSVASKFNETLSTLLIHEIQVTTTIILLVYVY